MHSNTEPQEVADVNVKFVRDTSRIWYKPNISREQGIIYTHPKKKWRKEQLRIVEEGG